MKKWCSMFDSIVASLRRHEIGVFPCDTVWGIIGLATPEVAKKIYELKKRPLSMPMVVLVPSLAWAETLTVPLADWQREAMSQFWPGPTTLVLPKSPYLDALITAHKPSVAIRLPDFHPLNAVLYALNEPIISTSANLSGQPIPSDIDLLRDLWLGQVDFLVDAYHPPSRKASVIWDYTQHPPVCLRV